MVTVRRRIPFTKLVSQWHISSGYLIYSKIPTGHMGWMRERAGTSGDFNPTTSQWSVHTHTYGCMLFYVTPLPRSFLDQERSYLAT